MEELWQAAALGLMSAVESCFARTPGPTAEEVNDAFWQACHGGQRRAAEYLLRRRGADLGWIPRYAKEPPLRVAGSTSTRQGILLDWLRGQGAGPGARPPA